MARVNQGGGVALNVEAQIKDIITRDMERIANDVKNTMKSVAESSFKKGYSTGELVRSIKVTRISYKEYFVGPDTDHDYYAEYGNGSNPITAKNGKRMAFTTPDGRKIVASSVKPYAGYRYASKTARKFR